MSSLIKKPVNTELNTLTYTAITMGSQTGYGFSLMLSDDNGFYIATDSEGTDETLIPGFVPGISWPDIALAGETILYAKAAFDNDPTLTLFPAKKARY